jgi:gliding motility-associated-like protein
MDIIVLCSNGNRACIYPNNSTTGVFSFGSRIELIGNSNPRGMDIADLDADGKPEIVFSNQLNVNSSVYRNTSTLSSISFATKVDITTGSSPIGLKLGDLDGDGKPDMVVLNPFANSYSVYRNTCTPGNITFASGISFPSDTFATDLYISDLDASGKLDLVLHNSSNSTPPRFTIVQNTSTIGTISFAPRVFIPTIGRANYMAIGNLDGDSLPDIIVKSSTDTIKFFKNYSTIGNFSFNQTGYVATGSGSFNALEIADIDLDGKPDIVSSLNSGRLSIIRQRYPIIDNTISGPQSYCDTANSVSFTGSIVNNPYNRSNSFRWVKSTTSANSGFSLAGGNDSAQNFTSTTIYSNTWFKRVYYWDFATDSSAATLISIRNITNNTIGNDQTITSGAVPATLTGSIPNGGTSITYQWISSLNITSGYSNAPGSNTSQNYSSGALTTTTYFKRIVFIGSCSDTSLPVKITILSAITLPQVITNSPSLITTNSASLGGNIINDGGANVTERGVVYGTSINPTTANTKVQIGTGLGTFSQNVTGLTALTTYHVRAYAINSVGTSYGADSTFTTLSAPVLASVTTASPVFVATTQATLGGEVIADGGANVTERGVVYGTSINPTTANTKVAMGSGLGVFSQAIVGLSSSAIYHVRAYAINSVGVSYGPDSTFTTATEINLPILTTSTPSLITTNSASLGGNIINNGGASVTERGVVFSTALNPTTSDNKVQIGNGTGSYSQVVTALTANTTYHVRAYAINNRGIAYGADTIFTTKPEPAKDVIIYTGFSPDGDGVNDGWVIENANELSGHTIIVYNVFGQEVFSQIGYDKAWDGTVDGNLVPSGEYYYLIKGDKVNKKGAILIKTIK